MLKLVLVLYFCLLLCSAHLIDAPNKYGLSPLMTACRHGDVAVVELLLASGADIEFQNEDGYSRYVCM